MSKLQEAQLALDRAADTLDEADYNLTGGFYTATVNRSYYAIFYCLTALLYTEDIQTKRHSGAQGKFHELFIRTNRFPRETLAWVQTTFQLRQSGDYDLELDITSEEAQESLMHAQQFYQLTRRYIDALPGEVTTLDS